MTLLAAALAASLQVRHVSVPAGTDGGSVRIECPVDQTTRIVFPERFLGLKVSAGAVEALGLVPEASTPRGVLRVSPSGPAAESRIRAQVASRSLVVILRVVAQGRGSEIRLDFASAQAAAASPPEVAPAVATPPPVEASPSPSPSPVPAEPAPAPVEMERAPIPSPAPSAEPGKEPAAEGGRDVSAPAGPAGLEALDAAALLRATPVRIGRREGRPGQREMVLEDALRGDEWVWLRFTLKKGAKRQVTRVFWEQGDVLNVAQEARGEDLALVVQLPRASVKPASRLNVAVSGEGEYRFALKDSSFVSFVKGLFY